jgi:DNA polymerase III subunit delta
MTSNAPVVYLLHGEDEFAISQFITAILEKMGDPGMADLNTTRLDGRTTSYQELEAAVSSLPFMGDRRLVLLSNPLTFLNNTMTKERFLALIPRISPAVALVLFENRFFTNKKDKKDKKFRWLEDLARDRGGRVYLKEFPLPKGGEMVKRIQELAKEAGGQISPPAAGLLVSLIGENPRLAQQEIQKLLAYVNYQRAIEEEDVHALTTDVGQGDIFAMVDAIGNRNGKLALQMLHRLLAEQDALSIFGMVTRQFRLLLLSREILDQGGQLKDVIRELNPPFWEKKLHPYVAEKVVKQVRAFSMQDLEYIYHRLLDLDIAIKSGELESVLALDTFIASTTA